MFNANKEIAVNGLNDAFNALIAMECFGNLSKESTDKLEDMLDSIVDMMSDISNITEE